MKKKAVETIISRDGYGRRSSRRFVIFTAFIFAMVATLSFLMTSNMEKTAATDFSGFKAGNIISDAVMRNYISMTESEIQTFLDKHVSCGRAASGGQYVNAGTAYGVKYNYKATYGGTTYFYHVENGKYVCMNSEKFNGETAAHIIYSLAHQYHINPQVLLVLLEKEQGLVSDNWPNSNFQYRSATGFGCPDTAPCDSEYYGLRNQVESAAWLFDQVLSGGWTNYDVGNNWIRFSPNASCGGSWVNIENKATAALYRYTPYQPNAAAIKNYPGGATCGAYGNRNFYAFFTDWFGSTQKVQYTFVQNYYNKNKNKTGNIIGDVVCTDQAGKVADFAKDGDYNCYQDFDKGSLFWNTNIKGSIRTESNEVFFDKAKAEAYKKLTPEQKKDPIYAAWVNNSDLGEVIKVEKLSVDNKYRVMTTQKAVLFGNDDIGYHVYKEKSFEKYVQYFKELGLPVSDWATNTSSKIEWYQFENGYIVGNDAKGWYPSMGKTRDVWVQQSWEFGMLGFPKSDIQKDEATGMEFQEYEHGAIIGIDVYFAVKENAYNVYKKYAKELGKPVSGWGRNNQSKIEWYQFENGYIVGNDAKGWYPSMGKTRDVWAKYRYESGILGFPKSDLLKNKDTNIEFQEYEHGYVVGNDVKGWYISYGRIRTKWAASGYEYGKYGFPQSDIINGCQKYEGGTICE